MNSPELQQKAFLLMLFAVSLAFIWILLPFYGTVFWASVLAIIFTPFHRRLLAALGQRRNLAAFTTLLLVLVIVILPVTLMTISLLQEGALIYQKIRTGELNFGMYFQQIMSAAPPWLVNLLDRSGLTNIAELQDMLSSGILRGSQFIATHALGIGQNAFGFFVSFGIMLYVLFFLLRDGDSLAAKIKQAMPLTMEHKRHLSSKFTTACSSSGWLTAARTDRSQVTAMSTLRCAALARQSTRAASSTLLRVAASGSPIKAPAALT